MKKLINIKINYCLLFVFSISSICFAQLGVDKLKSSENTYLNAQKEIKEMEQKMLAKANQFHFGNPKTPNSFGVKKGYCWIFDNGNVYYNTKANTAYAIFGPILQKWGEIGWENGWLGLPISNIVRISGTNADFATFTNGTITTSTKTGTQIIGGAFREYWYNDGGQNSKKLGLPKTDEVTINEKGYTRYQQFEFGTLFWGPNREVLYFPDANKTKPYTNFKIKLSPIQLNCLGSSDEVMGNSKELQLYGFMDVAVFDEFGQEIKNIQNTSNSLMDTNRNHIATVSETGSGNGSVIPVDDRIWQYDITSLDIENGYIRITYNFSDKDFYSSDDYLQLQGESGSWNYRNGSFKYRDIKLKELYKQGTTNKTDLFKETSQILNVIYSIKLYDLSN